MSALFLQGPSGRLEAEEERVGGARVGAVVCHAHPLYGGAMDNPVTRRAARALAGAGITTLRFNFRGVGESEGRFDGGRGERDDVRAALDWLARDHDRLWVMGYSFGAFVGLDVGAADARVERLIGVGVPVRAFDLGYLRGAGKPLLVVQGDRDGWGEIEAVRGLVGEAKGDLAVVEGADHFFEGKLDALAAAIYSWASKQR